MNWELASIIITIIVTLSAFIFKYFPNHGRTKWRENILVKFSAIEKDIENMKDNIKAIRDDLRSKD